MDANEKTEIRRIIAKHNDGESLTDKEYNKYTRYWVALRDSVEVFPELVGKGCFQYIVNKACECETANNHRMASSIKKNEKKWGDSWVD